MILAENPLEQQHGDIFVARITSVESSSFRGAYAHGFIEQRLVPGGRGYTDMEMGYRSGTTTQNPAFDINGGRFAVGTYAFLRLRGWVDFQSYGYFEPVGSGQAYDIVGAIVPSQFSGMLAGLGKSFPLDLNPLDIVPLNNLPTNYLDNNGYFNTAGVLFANAGAGFYLVTYTGLVYAQQFVAGVKSTYTHRVNLTAFTNDLISQSSTVTTIVGDVTDNPLPAYPFTIVNFVNNGGGAAVSCRLQVNWAAGVITPEKIAVYGQVFVQKLA